MNKEKSSLRILYEPIIKELIDLAENGIKIGNDVFRVTLATILGDSLSSYEIGGFQTVCNSYSFKCRGCGNRALCNEFNCKITKKRYETIKKRKYYQISSREDRDNIMPFCFCIRHPNTIQNVSQITELLTSSDFGSLDDELDD